MRRTARDWPLFAVQALYVYRVCRTLTEDEEALMIRAAEVHRWHAEEAEHELERTDQMMDALKERKKAIEEAKTALDEAEKKLKRLEEVDAAFFEFCKAPARDAEKKV